MLDVNIVALFQAKEQTKGRIICSTVFLDSIILKLGMFLDYENSRTARELLRTC